MTISSLILMSRHFHLPTTLYKQYAFLFPGDQEKCGENKFIELDLLLYDFQPRFPLDIAVVWKGLPYRNDIFCGKFIFRDSCTIF